MLRQYFKNEDLNRNMFTLMVIAVMSMSSFQAHAQSENSEESASFSHAKTILQKMSNYLSSADQFSFHAVMTEDRVFNKDYSIHGEVRSEIAIRRPDKVFADIKSDYNHKMFWYDGSRITLLTVPANYYATAEASGSIEEMTNFVSDNFGVHIPLATLAFENSFEMLTDGVIDGYYTGLHSVGGVSCHHLLFIDEDAEWQIWIEEGQNPVPRKYSVKYKLDDRDYVFVALIKNWQFNEFAPDEIFNFIPPPEAGEIEFVK